MFLLLAFMVSVALIYFLYSKCSRADEMMKGVKLFPGTVPLLGYLIRGFSVVQLGREGIKCVFEEVIQWKVDHRTSLLGIQVFLAVEADTLKTIFSSPYAITKTLSYKFLEFANEGILCAQSEEKWKLLRKKLISFFNPKYTEELINIANDKTKICIQILKETEGKIINIQEYVMRNLWDTVAMLFFGVDDNQQVERGPILTTLIASYIDDMLFLRAICLWHHPDFIFKFSKIYKDFMKVGLKYLEHSKQLMRKSLEIYEAKMAAAPEDWSIRKPYSQLYKEILESHYNERATLDKIAYGTNDLLVAGSDTVTIQISTLLYFLGAYPEYQEKVYEEVMELYSGGDWTRQQLSRMSYLDTALQEALRLSSPLMTGRKATRDIDIGKCTIPAGTTIFCLTRNNQISEEYIKDPMRFNPDNFLPERVKERPKNVFLPYTAGPRECPGQGMGSFMAKCLVAEVVRHFHISTTLDPKDIQYKYCLMTEFPDGYPVTLTRREGTTFSESSNT